MFENLLSAYAWLESQINFEANLGQVRYDERRFELEGFRNRLAALGNPHQGLKTVHIAGTRGKGSAALALEALLTASGQRTATYTSPHIREYRERIRIDGHPIEPTLFCELLSQIAQTSPTPSAGPFKTVFENLTALFFLAAQHCSVDWAVVETGLGGRLDATNVLPPGPVLWTRIGLEHTHLLGNTIAAIAGEKAAILKQGGWAVQGAQSEEGGAETVFANRANQQAAPRIHAAERCPIRQVRPHETGLDLTVEFEGRPLSLRLPFLGPFQAENIQNALAMLATLRQKKLIPCVPDEALILALAELKLPGRMERIGTAPELIADGAHCPTGARALTEALKQHFGEHATAGLILGMMSDKDSETFITELARWHGWRWVSCVTAPSPRARTGAELAKIAERFLPTVRVFPSVEQALESADRQAEKIDRIVVTGSIYLIASAQDWGHRHE